MPYGHRRDPACYAAALVAFDECLGGFLPHVDEDDLLIITADHGNDPMFRGTDHTRERVPLLVNITNGAKLLENDKHSPTSPPLSVISSSCPNACRPAPR